MFVFVADAGDSEANAAALTLCTMLSSNLTVEPFCTSLHLQQDGSLFDAFEKLYARNVGATRKANVGAVLLPHRLVHEPEQRVRVHYGCARF